MELCNRNHFIKIFLEGEFEELWRRRGKKIPEEEAIGYLKQILNGMKGLHEVIVIHRDIKLANILIDDNVLKIADLGFAK
jgi:serine/threonine protein kinase